MSEAIGIYYRDQEIGKLGFDEEAEKSFFQYHPRCGHVKY